MTVVFLYYISNVIFFAGVVIGKTETIFCNSVFFPQFELSSIYLYKKQGSVFANAVAKSAANNNHVLPAIALFLLCLALYPESQQPLSESTDKPGGEQWKVTKSVYILHFQFLNRPTRTESPVFAETNWLRRPFSWQNRWCLSAFTVLMCSRSTVDERQRDVRKLARDRWIDLRGGYAALLQG